MADEESVAIPAPPVDLKRKLDEVETDVPDLHAGSDDGSNGVNVDDSKAASDFSQAKRPKLDDEAADRLDNGKAQENGSPVEVKEEEQREEEPKEEETEKPSAQKDDNQDSEPLVVEVKDPIHADESENKTCGVDQPADDHVKPEDNQKSFIESVDNIVEECKDVNGGEPQKEVNDESKELNDGSSQKEIGKENKQVDGEDPQKRVDDTQSTTRRIDVPSSKVGVLIGKGGETVRQLQFNSGAKIQILRDSEADPNSALRPVEIIGTVACIENAEKLINAVIEAEPGDLPALVARGHPATHAVGIPEQIEIKVPNDKVGVIIGRGGETIKNMQTRSGARIQLIPQHAEGDGLKERTVRISGNKRQIDIATDMIKDVMYQNARPSPYPSGYNQPAYRPRGPGGQSQWGSRGPHSMAYDYQQRGSYSHYNSPGYPPHHMPPRSGGWDQRPSHSGPYDYYGRQGGQTSGPLAPPSGPPPSQVNYGYGGPDYGHAAPYSQSSHHQTYGQMYEQPNNPPVQPPYGGSYPQAGGSRPYQGPVQQGYGPPRPAAAAYSSDVPYQGATPAAASYGSSNMAPQQQYGQQTYPSYNSAPPPSDGTQTSATAPAYQQQSVQQGGYGPNGGYGSYPSSQPAYGYNTSSQDPNYGYGGSQPVYSQAAPTQAGYEQQPATQPAGYAAAPGTQVKTQSPQSAYAQYDGSQVYPAPR